MMQCSFQLVYNVIYCQDDDDDGVGDDGVGDDDDDDDDDGVDDDAMLIMIELHFSLSTNKISL